MVSAIRKLNSMDLQESSDNPAMHSRKEHCIIISLNENSLDYNFFNVVVQVFHRIVFYVTSLERKVD